MTTCRSGKQGFGSPSEASEALRKMLKRHGYKRGVSESTAHIYVCQFCKKRHIGHLLKGQSTQ